MAAEKKVWTRKERKELGRRLRSADPGLEVIHPDAAGIDVGNQAHYVAVRPDRDPQPVQRFGCFTADLYRLADWLKSGGEGLGAPGFLQIGKMASTGNIEQISFSSLPVGLSST
jgi:hypothetical protein